MRIQPYLLLSVLFVAWPGWGAEARAEEGRSDQASSDGVGVLANLSVEQREWLAGLPPLVVGVDTSWYPFEFVDDLGRFSGISADYVDFAGKTLGLDLQPEWEASWAESFEAFKQGEVDVLSAIIPTKERRQEILFTKPYFVAPTVIVTRRNSFYAESMSSLEGRRLGLVRGFAIVELVRTDYPELDIVLVDSIIEGLESLRDGRVDAYLGALSVVNYEIQTREMGDLMVAGFSPYRFEIAMAVRPGLEPLVEVLDEALVSMGERQKAAIANDWLAIHVETGADLGMILAVGLPILGVLLTIIVIIVRFNRQLKKEIDRREVVEAELTRLAQSDPLTGLSNLRSFNEQSARHLAAARRSGSGRALLFVDLDDFKQVNDSRGHLAGDALLVRVAHRMAERIREGDLLARIGGDEFALLLSGESTLAGAESMASDLIELVSRPFEMAEGEVAIGASVGIAMFPKDGEDIETLIRTADAAMYAAKKSGRRVAQRLEE